MTNIPSSSRRCSATWTTDKCLWAFFPSFSADRMKMLAKCENPFALSFDDDERVPYPKWKFRRKHLKTWKFIKSTKIPFYFPLFCALFFCISCLPRRQMRIIFSYFTWCAKHILFEEWGWGAEKHFIKLRNSFILLLFTISTRPKL